ncbi:hypothetical protein L3Y34_011304 [Caenorhabditis briggsae]|uniref:cyclin-dependent kinase n=2 Tax=Caenorhabditis briggsae TaxID=6238 RepID=A0AAE8ZRF7_CAEBR|nr:hypothetical protein L3Y34_011304 [Caenorhabditis briggsae]
MQLFLKEELDALRAQKQSKAPTPINKQGSISSNNFFTPSNNRGPMGSNSTTTPTTPTITTTQVITMKSTHENRDRKRRYSSSDDESRQSRFSVRPNNDKPSNSNSNSNKTQSSRDREIRRNTATRNDSRRFEKDQRGARREERCRESDSRTRSSVSRKSKNDGFGNESHRDQSFRRKSPYSKSTRRDHRDDRESHEKSSYRRETDNFGNVAKDHYHQDHRTKSPVEKRAKRSDQAEDRHCENRRRHDKSRTRSPMSKGSDGWDEVNTSDSTTTKRSRDTSSTSPDSQASRSSEASYRRSEFPEIDVTKQLRRYNLIMDTINHRNNKAVALEIGAVFSPKPLRDENESVAAFSFEDACGPALPNKASIWESDGKNLEESDKVGKSKSGSGQGSPLGTPPPGSPIRHNMLVEADVICISDDKSEDAEFKYDTTPPPEELDAMADEEKAKYTSAIEVRKRRQHEQEICELPVSFPGLYGCRHISEYHILNKISAGTFGEVFRGKHTRTDEIVALKRLNMEYEEEEFPITALREIDMLLKADDHENVVNVREVLLGRTVFDVYMAMEYIENDVKNWIDILKHNGKRFRIGHTKNLVCQLLQGISHLHDLWILHRNLKPANLLISSSGVLKIADFGLAREFVESKDIEKRTKMTLRVVTLWYRSPELLLHPITYSTPIDMWSVGCIMAEFITMHPLFQGCDEPNQVDLIFRMMGTPSEKNWPTINELRLWQPVTYPVYKQGEFRRKFLEAKLLDENGFDLLNGLLTMDPSQRLTASEALKHPWFNGYPESVPNEKLPLTQADGNHAPVVGQKLKQKSRLKKTFEERRPRSN